MLIYSPHIKTFIFLFIYFLHLRSKVTSMFSSLTLILPSGFHRAEKSPRRSCSPSSKNHQHNHCPSTCQPTALCRRIEIPVWSGFSVQLYFVRWLSSSTRNEQKPQRIFLSVSLQLVQIARTRVSMIADHLGYDISFGPPTLVTSNWPQKCLCWASWQLKVWEMLLGVNAQRSSEGLQHKEIKHSCMALMKDGECRTWSG